MECWHFVDQDENTILYNKNTTFMKGNNNEEYW